MKTAFASEFASVLFSGSIIIFGTLPSLGNAQTFAPSRSLPGTSGSALENLNNPGISDRTPLVYRYTTDPTLKRDPSVPLLQSESESQLVSNAEELLRAGKIDEAEAKLLQALRDHPDYLEASSYLDSLKQLRERKAALHTIDRIIFDRWDPPKTARLSEIAFLLDLETNKRNPDKRRIRFLFPNQTDFPLPDAIDPLTGAPNYQPPESGFTIQTDRPLINVRLPDLLDSVVKNAIPPAGQANSRLRYTVREHAVVFSVSKMDSKGSPLLIRTFKVDRAAFLAQIKGSGNEKGSADMRAQQKMVRDFFIHAGARFEDASQGPVEQTPDLPTLFFNERTGLLSVRANQSDIEIIESALVGADFIPQ